MRYFLLFLLLSTQAHALVIDQPLEDALLERRAHSLFLELRCQVCDGQSVADSNAIIAQQLRKEVRRLLLADKSDTDIRLYLAEAYGKDILFRTASDTSAAIVWFMPLAFVLFGITCLVVFRRKDHT